MSQIQILPEHLINQIAAGEVVDRPASVVKELVENALDAGADQIQVTVLNGGKDLISVLDNGQGMDEADARLSIARHATSKIHSAEDLERILTMGFRGEALAAISSVSKFELTTCSREDQGGFQLRLEAGKETSAMKVGFPRGTRVTVEDLFYNLPARKKFLKSQQTELLHIHELLLNLSLGHPQVAFRLTHNKKMLLNCPKGEDLFARIQSGFGREVAQDLILVEHEESYLSFQGYFSHPAKAKNTKRWQHSFVNDRHVRCPAIVQGIYEGYKTLLMKNMHPLFFIKLKLLPGELDVNVHPAKTEIRVRNPNLIHTILAERISHALKKAGRQAFFSGASLETAGIGPSERQEMDQVKDNPMPATPPPAPTGLYVEVSNQMGFHDPLEKAPRAKPVRTWSSKDLGLPSSKKPQAPPQPRVPQSEAFSFQALESLMPAQATLKGLSDSFQAIGQFQNKYILAQGKDRLVLVDQHAAHERIRFEEIRREFFQGEIQAISLVIPLMLELPPQDGILLEQHEEAWRKLGFVIEAFGGKDYAVKEVPSLLKDKDIGQVIKEVLEEMAQFGKAGKLEVFFNEVFERMACHSAIRAGQTLAFREQQSLLDRLEGLDLQVHCPHGRPVWVEITAAELDRRFKRVL